MEVIVRPRRGGKTTELIKRAAAEGGVILVATMSQKEHVIARAKEMKATIPEPVTFGELRCGACQGQTHPLLIDEAQDLLRQACGGVPIAAITITDDEKTQQMVERGLYNV